MSRPDQPWPPNSGQQQPGAPGWQPQFGGPQQQPGWAPLQPGYPPPGYPPQFAGQPGCGAPPPPQPPQPPRKRNPWPWLIPLVVVVVAAAITVPIVLTRDGSGDSTASGPGRPHLKSWKVTVSQTGGVQNSSSNFGHGFGAWTYADELITVTGSAVTAYGRADGKQRWKMSPPEADSVFCGASRNVSDDRIAVAYGPTHAQNASNQLCTSIALVNLETGKFVWKGKYIEDASVPPDAVAMQIVGKYLYVGFSTLQVALQIDMATGKIRSHADIAAGTDPNIEFCSISDITATKTTVYYLANCEPDPTKGSATFDLIRAQDADTGQLGAFGEVTAQNAQLPQDASRSLGVDAGEFISASPMVVTLNASGVNVDFHTSFVGIDSTLQVVWALAGLSSAPTTLDGMPVADNAGFGRAFVANGTLFTETNFEVSDQYVNNRVTAIDAANGATLWSAGMDNVAFDCPVAVQDGAVVAVGRTIGDANSDVVLARFDVNSGKLGSSNKLNIPVYANGATLPDVLGLRGIWFVAADNRVYGAETSMSKADQPQMPMVFSLG